jgi:hypothetical protein
MHPVGTVISPPNIIDDLPLNFKQAAICSYSSVLYLRSYNMYRQLYMVDVLELVLK